MNRLSVVFIATIWMCTCAPAVVFAQVGQAAPKKASVKPAAKAELKKGNEKESEVVGNPKEHLISLASLRENLVQCKARFDEDTGLAQSSFQLKIAEKRLEYASKGIRMAPGEYDRVFARQAVMKEMSERGWEHEKCVTTAKATLGSTGRTLVDGLKGEALKGKAKEMLAQWIAAADAVDKKHFDQELSKFDTLANGIVVELTLN